MLGHLYTHRFHHTKDVVASYEPLTWIPNEFGINADGTYTKPLDTLGDATDTDGDDGDCAGDGEGDHATLTAYPSKEELEKLCRNLVKNTWERTLCAMARETTTKVHLDLSVTTAKPLLGIITSIGELYKADFCEAKPVSTSVTHKPANTAPEMVVVVHSSEDDEIADEESYNRALKTWNGEVVKFEDIKLKEFLRGHVEAVVHATDESVDLLKKKLARVPIMGEKKRKAFDLEVSNMKPLDWDRLKRRKQSMFQPLELTMTSADVEPLIEVYSQFRTENEQKESNDVIVVTVPGPLPTSPFNKNAEVVFKQLSKITPKHPTPKVGVIELAQADVLRRIRGRMAFQGKTDDHMVFTSQLKGTFERKQMKVLPGDSYFNKWPTTTMPLASMVRIKKSQHLSLFSDASCVPFHDSEECPHADQMTDELGIADDDVVPYPHEHEKTLAVEKQNIFGTFILVDLAPGSGEKEIVFLFGLNPGPVRPTPPRRGGPKQLIRA